MEKNRISEKLFEWLAERDYDELSSIEQAEVLRFMSTQDYSDMRTAVDSFIREDTEVNKIIERQPRKKQLSILSRVINYRLPFYKVAASFLLFMGFLYAFGFVKIPPHLVQNKVDIIQPGVSIDEYSYPDEMVFEL